MKHLVITFFLFSCTPHECDHSKCIKEKEKIVSKFNKKIDSTHKNCIVWK